MITYELVFDKKVILGFRSLFEIRYNFHLTISDEINLRTGEYERRIIANDGIPDEHFLEADEITIQ